MQFVDLTEAVRHEPNVTDHEPLPPAAITARDSPPPFPWHLTTSEARGAQGYPNWQSRTSRYRKTGSPISAVVLLDVVHADGEPWVHCSLMFRTKSAQTRGVARAEGGGRDASAALGSAQGQDVSPAAPLLSTRTVVLI
jgi:hypothetical protein